MSDTLETEVKPVNNMDSDGLRGMGRKLIKNIQGIFIKKQQQPNGRRMSYKEIMKMRDTSKLWEEGEESNKIQSQSNLTMSKKRGMKECLMDIQVTQENNQYVSSYHYARSSRSSNVNKPSSMRLGSQSSRNIIKKKVIYRVPRMSDRKPKPMKESLNRPSNIAFQENSKKENLEFLPKRLSHKREEESESQKKPKESVDPVIVLGAKREKGISLKSHNQSLHRKSKRAERSSSVFSNLKKKRTEDNNGNIESNGSRVSSYSRRKNRFHEKSSEKKSRRSSKIKVKYGETIKPIRKLKLPPMRKTKANKENVPQLQISPGPLTFGKNRKIPKNGHSPLSSRRSNKKLKSDRVSSIQIRIAQSKNNLEGGSIESQESVICDISSFKDLEFQKNEKSNKEENYNKLESRNTKYTESRVKYEHENTNHTEKLKYTKRLDRFGMDQISSKKSNRGVQRQLSSRNDLFMFDTNGRLVREELFGNIQSGDSDNDWGRNSKEFKNALEMFLKQKHV
jgi:hypothetical protein